jgi:hypothetical protein
MTTNNRRGRSKGMLKTTIKARMDIIFFFFQAKEGIDIGYNVKGH